MSSQLGQDHFVLAVLNGMRGGYFLDSGAADGIRSSNTLLLESAYGWRGICIEPNDRYFQALQANRHCICVHSCLYDQAGEVDFVENANMLGGILQEYPPAMLRYARSLFGPLNAVRKPARTIASILKEHQAPAVIDYWSLDTEGSELAILKSFPFDEYRLRLLTVEHNRQPVRAAIQHLLEARGYRRIHDFGIDDGYLGPGEPLPGNHAAWRSAAWRR